MKYYCAHSKKDVVGKREREREREKKKGRKKRRKNVSLFIFLCGSELHTTTPTGEKEREISSIRYRWSRLI